MAQLSIDQAMRLAAQHHQQGQLHQAEQICRQVLAVAPDHSDALHLLGVIALDTRRLAQAIEMISRSIAINPNAPECHYHLGVALLWSNQLARAADAFRQAIALKPDLLPAHGNLAAVLVTLRQFDEAIDASRATLARYPNHAETWNSLGLALKESDLLDEAISALERAITINPDFPEALTNLGNALHKAGRAREAIAVHQRARALRPQVPEIHNNLATALYDEGEYEQAIESGRRALALKPDFKEAQCSLANTLYAAGRLQEGIAEARKAIALWPESPLPKFNLGLMLLLAGEFEEGWRLNEARWQVPELKGPPQDFGRPRWDGSDLQGKTILLYGEQGFGDTIQFVRYVPMVRARGASRIILGCQSELLRLLRRVEGIERVISRTDGSIPFDVHSPLMSLPLVFGTNLTNIPAPPRYLWPDPELVVRWRERIGKMRSAECGMRNAESPNPKSAIRPGAPGQSALKIGLVWAGRPTHDNDRNRSIPLSNLSPLAQIPGLWFCSLQKGEAAREAQIPPAGMSIADFSTDVQDFADTAAIIESLDLVISVDTAAAHLAAALGKPTWLLLSYRPDWRWLMDRTDSPWYPTMRLFRQPRPRDWRTPIEEIARSLVEKTSVR